MAEEKKEITKTKKEKRKEWFREYGSYILIIIIVLLVKKFVVSPIRVNGSSMEDTLHNGDVMILNIIGCRFSDIERFDIVVVDEKHEYLIKRVIGLPGEKIEYKDNKLYVNGKLVKDNHSDKITEDFYYNVPKDSYFVMGDNRTNSLDSRYFGAFKKKDVVGKTKLVIFPFSRFGNKK